MQNRDRIFISASRDVLPYVRYIQLLLEEQYNYFTYINERPTHENIVRFDDNLEEIHRQEFIHHSTMMTVESAVWRRRMVDRPQQEAIMHQLFGTTTFYYVEIDEAYQLAGTQLEQYLQQCVANAFNEVRSGWWDFVPSHPSQLPAHERLTLHYADRLLTDYSDELALEAMRVTRGEIIPYIYYLEATNTAHFNQSKPPEISWLDFALGKFIDVIKQPPQNANNLQSHKRRRFTEIMLKDFYMYPPHIPQGAVFLSHSTRNLIEIRHLQLLLEYAGYRTFCFRFGQYEQAQLHLIDQVRQLLQEIMNEIAAADIVILAKSPEFEDSPWTFAEMALAALLDKPVYAIDITPILGADHQTRHDFLKTQIEAKTEVDQAQLPYALGLEELVYILAAHPLVQAFRSTSDEELVAMTHHAILEASLHQHLDHPEVAVSNLYLVFASMVRHRLNPTDLESRRLRRINALVVPDHPLSRMILDELDAEE